MKKLLIVINYSISLINSGVDRFVNFGHGFWWYGGYFCQKAGKYPEKLFPKEIILKKVKKPGVGSKIRNKLCIKNEFFHIYAHKVIEMRFFQHIC